ncbi:serine/threonine-protein kinase RsbW [Algoriphagus ratkowskyi]|uniref:ATP-binding protein n=1 Tax=Algoriphagus ratkowskyi TaxID=57028 RepID=A0A2W7RH46_9BACT|nr:ATP-binding protein [Algoriphagus ratkowskyi]PZX59714.1 serine/threonine-protein kinase RsbW [Algoriphagus ratkowskyi]TXD78570.1 ATP-binding protein [Algoriphagus ratkowskyi]
MNHQLKISCQTTALSELRVFLKKTLAKLQLTDIDQLQITLAVEEVCANLIIHSHQCNALDYIQLKVKQHPGKLIFEISDKGKAFNMLDYEVPDLDKVKGEKRKGGLGIILVKKIMDEIEFESSKGTNTCRLIKWFHS